MTSDENVPIDATAMNAEAVVRAALAWRSRQGSEPILSRVEWVLFVACDAYGKEYRGLRGT